MSLDQAFGFRSRLVLHKLGHDLRLALDTSGDPHLPASWEALAEAIGDRADATLTLQRSEDSGGAFVLDPYG